MILRQLHGLHAGVRRGAESRGVGNSVLDTGSPDPPRSSARPLRYTPVFATFLKEGSQRRTLPVPLPHASLPSLESQLPAATRHTA